jgi:AraC-like DNA-binding protein
MLLYLSLFTILLAIVLLIYNKKSNSNALFLALFFILCSLFGIAHYFVFQTQDLFWTAVFFNHFVPFMFLTGPFMYLYVRGTLNKTRKLKIKDSWHFIPAILSFIGTIPYYCTPFDTKITIAKRLITDFNSIRDIDVNLLYDAGESFVLRSVLCLIYVFFSGYRVILYYKNNRNLSQHQLLVVRWLTILLSATLIITSLFLMLAFEASFVKISETITNGYAIYFATGVLYFIMTIALLQFPSVLYGIPKKEPKKHKLKKHKKSLKAIQIEAESKSTTNEELVEISSKIEHFLTTEKPFLDPQFSVFSIAVALGVSETQVNHAIKNGMQTSFVKLRTELRVAHAINLLQSITKEHLTIEAIGAQSGFKTRSNFYMAFKEITGQTPTEYIHQE